MGLLDGKVAIVTGAGRGVGRGEALELASQGAKVVVNDLGGSQTGEGADKSPADEVVEIIKQRGGEAVSNYDDISSWGGAENLINTARDAFGKWRLGDTDNRGYAAQGFVLVEIPRRAPVPPRRGCKNTVHAGIRQVIKS